MHRFQPHPPHFLGDMGANLRTDHASTSFAGDFSLAVTNGGVPVDGVPLTEDTERTRQVGLSK
ncbi:MAG: hypothetical protein V9E82_12860 [Candidatus Nanopelagicales bacterium]